MQLADAGDVTALAHPHQGQSKPRPNQMERNPQREFRPCISGLLSCLVGGPPELAVHSMQPQRGCDLLQNQACCIVRALERQPAVL